MLQLLEKKKEKQYVRIQLSIPQIHGEFSDNVAPNINSFTNEPVVQYDIEFVKNSFIDYFKEMTNDN